MSIRLASNLFITSSLKLSAGFYQQLIGGLSSFQELGNNLIKIAEQAQAFRQHDRLKEAAQVLINMPTGQYQSIGYYYFGLFEYRSGKSPKEIFERVAEEAPTAYRVRAMQSLSLIEGRKQDYASELYWLAESLKLSPSVDSLRGIAIVKAKEGYHQSAVKDLEKLYPFLRHADPLTYYQYLNSLAVELGEVGRKDEARNVIKHVLESPFIIAYPEWQETAEELRGANRSSVVIGSSPARMGKLLSMPVIEHTEPAKQDRPAPVVSLETWKAKMVKKHEKLDSRQLLLRLMELGISQGMTDDKMLKVIELMEKLLNEPQKPDDEGPGA